MDLSTANDKTHGPGTDKDIQVKNVQQTQAQSQQPQYRTLYIIVFGSALFKAHWSFWAPNIEDRTQKTGKKAQAVGSVADGFQIEFVRNYNLTSDTRQPTIIEIGQIQTDHLQDSPDSGNATDSSPTDHFERIALSIPAPRASLNKKNPLSCIDEGSQKTGRDIGVAGPSRDIARPPPRRVNLQDCQYWIKQVVDALVVRGDLIAPQRGQNAGRDPREIVANAPQH